MSKIVDNIVQSRAGGRVERCHTIPHIGSYSVAAHSWGVAMLMYYIWPEHFQRLAIHCLVHDIPEAWVGDIPATALWAVPELREVMEEHERRLLESIDLPYSMASTIPIVKACDQLELYLWCREQLLMGNELVLDCKRALEDLFHNGGLPERAMAVYHELRMSDLKPRQQNVLKELTDAEPK